MYLINKFNIEDHIPAPKSSISTYIKHHDVFPPERYITSDNLFNMLLINPHNT